MPTSPRTFAAISLVGGVLAFSPPAIASPSVVTVTLDNKPISDALPDQLGMAMPMADMSKAVMSAKAPPSTVPAGDVTFVATNKSPEFVQEMVLVTDPQKQLPYSDGDGRVTEPGTYMLFCNLPGHYMAGMWTTITVQ